MVGKRHLIIPSPTSSVCDPLAEATILEESGLLGTWNSDMRADRVRCSPGCARLFGIHPDDGLHGVSISAFAAGCHPDDWTRLTEETTAACANGTGLFETEYRTVARNGRVRRVLARGRMIVDEAGLPLASRGMVIDVTDTRAAADAASDEAARLDRLADHAIAQQHIVARMRQPRLKQLVDMLTFEIGSELARRIRPLGRGRMH